MRGEITMSMSPGWDDMSVQDLIDELMKIENKRKIVKFNQYEDVDEIQDWDKNFVYILLK